VRGERIERERKGPRKERGKEARDEGRMRDGTSGREMESSRTLRY
jgi:hypothetical protein